MGSDWGNKGMGPNEILFWLMLFFCWVALAVVVGYLVVGK